MMMRSTRAVLPLVASLVAFPACAWAQANLSGQGFGFPTGQFSTRAEGTGGAVGEMDPLSPVNPAAIGALQVRSLFFQAEPEYRTVTSVNGREHTTTARYPIIMGSMPIGKGIVMSLSASSLLDRTSTTSFTSSQTLESGEVIPMTTTYQIDGGMSDVRLAAAWTPKSWLRVGFGAHGITGSNLVNLTQSFEDTTQFATFTQQRILGYHGAAASAGFQLLSKTVIAASSVRVGGRVRLSVQDTLLGTADVPTRFGASLAYIGLANSVFAVRTSHENWSSLTNLGTPGLQGVDSWDTSIGADLAGPRFADRVMFIRTGFRTRTLPFQAANETVRENSVSLGTGTIFARGRVLGDVALIRAWRSADLPASERAWILSFGISVRP